MAPSGAALQFLASVLDAKEVAEFGTGTGVSGLWLLRGMAADGVLTSIDREAEHQRLARETFTEAGIAPQRFRLITGSALDVAPRLNSDGYDLVFIDGDKTEYSEYLVEAQRLVRPGGVIAFDNALWHDRVAERRVSGTPTRPPSANCCAGGRRRRAIAAAPADRRWAAGRSAGRDAS